MFTPDDVNPLEPDHERVVQPTVQPEVGEMVAHYLRVHLTGAAAGIELFGRADGHGSEVARIDLLRIRGELEEEREQLLEIADTLGVRPAPLSSAIAKVGEKLERLKPDGSLLHRTALSDLLDLEAMRDAVAGKVAGWQALLTVTDRHPGLDRDRLADLLTQGEEQHRTLTELHAAAAREALR